jgi:sulfonate transport system substrate-binding protein
MMSVVAIAVSACGSSTTSGSTEASSSAPDSTVADTALVAPSTEAAPDLSTVTLTVGVTTSRGKARQAIRLESKAFEGTPYTIKWVEFASGSDAVEALTAGAVDVVLELQPSNVVVAAGNAKEPWTEQTRKFVVVAGVRYETQAGVQVVVRPDSGINTVADLKGKKVAYSKGSNSEFIWAVLAKSEGLTTDDVEEVKIKASEAKAAFLAGEVDALINYDYSLYNLVRTGEARVIAASGAAGIPLYTVMTVRQGVLDDTAHRLAIGDLITRNEAAEAWPIENLASARALWEELDAMDPADSEQMVLSAKVVPVALVPDVVDGLQQQFDVFFARGSIEFALDARVIVDVAGEPIA